MMAVKGKPGKLEKSRERSVKMDTPRRDRRVRKTTNALKHALTVLMQKKTIKDITVKELTDIADVNRGTFYLHYEDVFDLLSQSEGDFFAKLREAVELHSEDFMSGNPVPLFCGVYELCRDNADLVSILIGENGDINFLNQLKTFLREKCLNDWSAILRRQGIQHFDAYFSFIVGGCLSLLQYWFHGGMIESPEELAEITGVFLAHHM